MSGADGAPGNTGAKPAAASVAQAPPVSSPAYRRIRARGLDFHVSQWGEGRPRLVLLHGWGDCGETFGPVLAELAGLAGVCAPDMRGFGKTAPAEGGYVFADYVPDLHALLETLSPEQPVALAGHSMGAQIASLYAGVCPQRVSQLLILDGLFLPDSDPAQAPRRYRSWLHQLEHPPQGRVYDSFDALAERIRKQHPALDGRHARAIAELWATECPGGVTLRMDPRHRMHGPHLFRVAESMAIWREITAPTLFLDGGASAFARAIGPEEVARRRACFPGHEAQVIPKAGHMLHFDAPEATARHMRDWLQRQGWPESATPAPAATRPNPPAA